MKLLIVSQYFYPEPFRVSDVSFRLAALGHDVTVLTGLPNYPIQWEKYMVNIKVKKHSPKKSTG